MNNFISYNGSLVEKEKLNADFFNRSFSYGDGLFETVKMMDSKILFWEDHFERLLVGIRTLKMLIPASFNSENVKSEMLKLALKNNTKKNARIKINLFRDSSGWYQPTTNSFSYIIQTIEDAHPFYQLNPIGLKIKIFKEIPKPVNLLSGFKSCNSLVYVMAGIFAGESTLDEAVLLNEKKNICEAISSNVFIYKNNKWVTPPLNEGCIDGVMRKQLIRIMQSKLIDLKESVLTENDLLLADEVIITNVSRGIRWVAQLDEKKFSNTHTTHLLKLLNEEVYQ